MSNQIEYTEPQIITSNDINKRSYVEFYLNNKRVRIGNGDTLNQRISPNRANSLAERNILLGKLHFELKKALEGNSYPATNVKVPQGNVKHPIVSPKNEIKRSTIHLLFDATKGKIKSTLSKKYKRNLKSVYRQFRDYMTDEELAGPITTIKVARIDEFLLRFGSTGTYYMNKRRDLGVLFSAAGRLIEQPIDTIITTQRKRPLAKLHLAYDREQLKPVFNWLKGYNHNLYICCLLTYSSWLRPHEEVRLLTLGDFKKEHSEVHLTGSDNKGGKVRVVYIPDYVREELKPVLLSLNRQDNIFTKTLEAHNEFYFNTLWSRAYKKMFKKGLVYENQTLYSFRHTAAVDTYRRTKDVYLIQRLLGHTSILTTLKYLRSLGEFNTDELRGAAPQL